jgi:hypothetical protein
MAVEADGYVFRAVLTQSALAELLIERFGTRSAFAIVRRVDAAEFLLWKPSNVVKLLDQWTECQLFDSEAEVRWKKSDDVYQALLLTERHDPPVGFQPISGLPFTAVESSSADSHGFLLWGTARKQDTWFETRIPRPLHYPVNSDKKPKISYRLYRERASVRWVRLTGLTEVE